MNITFMIGNGFDVNLGLKTKFTDFYDTYFKSELDRVVPESVKNFIQLVLKDKDKFGNMDKWADFEKAFAENMEGSVEDVRDVLEDFTVQFSEYLKKEEEKCDYSNENVIDEFEKFLFSSHESLENIDKIIVKQLYIDRAENVTNNISFINFNFTFTLDNLVDILDNKVMDDLNKVLTKNASYRITNITHVHGTLKSNIVIAVDSIDQFLHQILGSKKELEDVSVKKAINYNSGKLGRDLSFKDQVYKSNIIYMYGLSLGETDKSHWEIIRGWLQQDKLHKLVYFAYNADLKKINRIFSQRVILEINKIKKDVMVKLGLAPDELESYYDQVFIIDSSDVLNFKLVDENKEPEANMN